MDWVQPAFGDAHARGGELVSLLGLTRAWMDSQGGVYVGGGWGGGEIQ
jgi:hypothetical protein